MGPARFVDMVEGGQRADLLSTLWKVSYDAKSTERRQSPNQIIEATFYKANNISKLRDTPAARFHTCTYPLNTTKNQHTSCEIED